MKKKIQLTETELINLIKNMIKEYDGGKFDDDEHGNKIDIDEVQEILKELGLRLNYNMEQIKGYSYITSPKNGFEFNIWRLSDDKFSVKTSYYGTIYKTEETNDLMGYLSNMLRSKPNIIHKYNYEFKK